MVTRGGAEHRYLRCTQCSSLNLAYVPAFEEIEVQHAGRYHGAAREKFPAVIERALELLEGRRARWIARFLLPGARVLDVGCGRGVMAAALQRAGFDVSVTELNPSSAAGAVGRGVRQVYTGPDALASFAPGSLDAVSMFHSLEHFDDAAGTVARLAALLRPGGQFFVEVPLLSKLARRFGASWFHLDPPRHTVLFTDDGLGRAMAAARLRLRETHRFSLEFSAPSLALSVLGLRLGSDGLYASAHVTSPGWFRRVCAAALLLAGSGAALLPAAVLATTGAGDVLRARFEVVPS